jgi:hypothetical protein
MPINQVLLPSRLVLAVSGRKDAHRRILQECVAVIGSRAFLRSVSFFGPGLNIIHLRKAGASLQ